MSNWSDLGLPNLQAANYEYQVNPGLLRTPFETELPAQKRRYLYNFKTITAVALLNTQQLNIAENFLKTYGYSYFTADLISQDGTIVISEQSVRLIENIQVQMLGYNAFKITLVLEKPAQEMNFLQLEMTDLLDFNCLIETNYVNTSFCNWIRCNAPDYDWTDSCINDRGRIAFLVTYSTNSEGSIFMSTNKGADWYLDREGQTFFQTIDCNYDGTLVIASSIGKTFRREGEWIDGEFVGEWEQIEQKPLQYITDLAMSKSGDNVLGVYGQSHVWVSNNRGITFNEREFPVVSAYMKCDVSDDFMKMIVAPPNSELHICTDGIGVTWTPISICGSHSWTDVAISGDGMKIIACHNTDPGNWVSLDGGASWNELLLYRGSGIRQCAISRDGNVMVINARAGTEYNQWYSLDGGATWQTCENEELNHLWDTIAINADGSIAIAAVNDNGVFRISTD